MVKERHEAIKKAKKLMGFSPDILDMYEKLNPELLDIISKFDDIILKDGALPTKTKRLIALGIIISNQCGYCVEQQLKATFNAGATKEEIAELLGVVLLTSGAPAVASCRDVISGMIKDI
jgi:AhpD family alkylhydroperoxidase